MLLDREGSLSAKIVNYLFLRRFSNDELIILSAGMTLLCLDHLRRGIRTGRGLVNVLRRRTVINDSVELTLCAISSSALDLNS